MNYKLEHLIKAIIDETSSGRLKWEVFDDDSFRVKVGPGYLHLQRNMVLEPAEDGIAFSVPRYSVQISDRNGRVVLETEESGGPASSQPGIMLDRLFGVARESGLQSDSVIGEMLSALGQDM